MRTRTVAALALLLAFGPAACARAAANDPQVASAGKKPSASAGPSTSASEDPDAPLKYAKCMREHGMTWFPDPATGSGAQSLSIPQGTDPKKFDAAQEACKKFMPDGGEIHKPTGEEIQQVRDMAKCMRENGVPNFPDPKPNGELAIDPKKLGTGPGDPTFDKAEKTCEKYMPNHGEKRTENHSDGGSGGTTNQGRAA
jgi:hypothetical protein